MEQNKLTEYAQHKEKDSLLANLPTMADYEVLLDNDLKAGQHIGDIWRALCDIQRRLNQLYWVIHEKEGESESGKGSGQMKLKEVPPELALEPTQEVPQEPQVAYQPKTAAEVTDRVAAMRNQVSQQANPAISQRYSSGRPGH